MLHRTLQSFDMHFRRYCDRTENSTSHEDSIRIKIESILMMSASFWIFIIFLTGIVLKAPQYAETSITIVGAFCIISSLVFYGAPLINMVEIVRLKDSSSLYGPALCVNGLSCFLWFFYGLIGVNAVIVWLPNIIGLLLVCVELAMCCIYPAKRHKSIASISEVEPTYDYAVYSSSRHMSSADLVLPIIGMESEKSRAARSSSKARNMLFSISEKYPMSGLEENKMDTEEYEENPYYSKEAMKSRPLGNNSETQSA